MLADSAAGALADIGYDTNFRRKLLVFDHFVDVKAAPGGALEPPNDEVLLRRLALRRPKLDDYSSREFLIDFIIVVDRSEY